MASGSAFSRIVARRRSHLFAIQLIIIFSLGSGVAASPFCPHRAGGCFPNVSHLHKKITDGDHHAGHACHGAEMNEQAAAGMLSEMPDQLLQAMADSGSDAVTPVDDGCAHCLIHSHSVPSNFASLAIQNGPANQTYAVDSPVELGAALPVQISFFDLHEHGPPGTTASPVYILVSAFRI